MSIAQHMVSMRNKNLASFVPKYISERYRPERIPISMINVQLDLIRMLEEIRHILLS